ncbi:MAG: peptidylprolyl isomerase [Bacteroidales bacterium]|nr:peptidylprolyl isomerase [Bacteroidales bacterium]
MKKIILIALILFSVNFLFCKETEKTILIETNFGNIKIKLYNETPLHCDNFIKLVNEEYFEDLLFHRVINNFMIQGGDPDSRNAEPEIKLGDGSPDYTIPAEFVPSIIHKKGVIAAAREGDALNPEKRSSGSQFYIVQGKIFTNEELDKLEEKINSNKQKEIVYNYINKKENIKIKTKLDSLKNLNNEIEILKTLMDVEELTREEYENTEIFKLTDQQRQTYTTIGGTPHLDGSYTIFGEVIEGLEVIDKIAAVETDNKNRPINDVKMKISIVK